MARDFDGSTDGIALGSDASITDFSNLTVAFHGRWDGAGNLDVVINKMNSSFEFGWMVQFRTTNVIGIARDFTGGRQTWAGTTISPAGSHHITVSHNAGPTTLAVIQVDGVADTVVELEATTSGTLESDTATALGLGQPAAGAFGYDGALQNVCIANAVWTDAEKNRHRWWGCAPGGPSTVAVWLPLYTDGTANKGTATLSPTLTGTTVASLPRPTVRPGMGMGW